MPKYFFHLTKSNRININISDASKTVRYDRPTDYQTLEIGIRDKNAENDWWLIEEL